MITSQANMQRHSVEAEWDQRLEDLIRSIFQEPTMSPIPESEGSIKILNQSDRESDSPLPNLIIEREQRRLHDESEEYYDQLEKKIKKILKKIMHPGGSNSSTELDIDDYNHDTLIESADRNDHTNFDEEMRSRQSNNSPKNNNNSNLRRESLDASSDSSFHFHTTAVEERRREFYLSETAEVSLSPANSAESVILPTPCRAIASNESQRATLRHARVSPCREITAQSLVRSTEDRVLKIREYNIDNINKRDVQVVTAAIDKPKLSVHGRESRDAVREEKENTFIPIRETTDLPIVESYSDTVFGDINPQTSTSTPSISRHISEGVKADTEVLVEEQCETEENQGSGEEQSSDSEIDTNSNEKEQSQGAEEELENDDQISKEAGVIAENEDATSDSAEGQEYELMRHGGGVVSEHRNSLQDLIYSTVSPCADRKNTECPGDIDKNFSLRHSLQEEYHSFEEFARIGAAAAPDEEFHPSPNTSTCRSITEKRLSSDQVAYYFNKRSRPRSLSFQSRHVISDNGDKTEERDNMGHREVDLQTDWQECDERAQDKDDCLPVSDSLPNSIPQKRPRNRGQIFSSDSNSCPSRKRPRLQSLGLQTRQPTVETGIQFKERDNINQQDIGLKTDSRNRPRLPSLGVQTRQATVDTGVQTEEKDNVNQLHIGSQTDSRNRPPVLSLGVQTRQATMDTCVQTEERDNINQRDIGLQADSGNRPLLQCLGVQTRQAAVDTGVQTKEKYNINQRDIASQTDSRNRPPVLSLGVQTRQATMDTCVQTEERDNINQRDIGLQADSGNRPHLQCLGVQTRQAAVDTGVQTKEKNNINQRDIASQTDSRNRLSLQSLGIQTHTRQGTGETGVQTEERDNINEQDFYSQTDSTNRSRLQSLGVQTRQATVDTGVQTEEKNNVNQRDIGSQTDSRNRPRVQSLGVQAKQATVDIGVQTEERDNINQRDVDSQTEVDSPHCRCRRTYYLNYYYYFD